MNKSFSNIKTNKKTKELEESMCLISAITPKFEYMPDYSPLGKGNIKALTYDGATIDGKKTKVFAYIGYPFDKQEGKTYPAVVLLHGGCGHAYEDWVQYWNRMGYVALAMDNTGYFPTRQGNWVWGLSSNPDFNEDGYVNAPNNDNFTTVDKRLDKQWMYHAVAQAILAKNLLKEDPYVDSNKVGIVGISWGSKIVAQAIGFEKFAFAVGQYVSAYLDLSLTHNSQYSENENFNYLWVAENRFNNVDFPVLWTQWTKDTSASILSTSATYLGTPGSIMSLRMDWAHYHDWTTPVEIYRFADSVVKGGYPLPTIKEEPSPSNSINFRINVPIDTKKVTAKAWYIKEKLTYINESGTYKPVQEFFSVDLDVKLGGRVSGMLPNDAHSFYVEISTEAGGETYYIATSFQDIDPA